jgi:8-oxo-dGTP diphosphatase
MMGISEYVAGLRALVGHDLLMLPSVSAVVRNSAGEFLLGQRSDTSEWSLIAGSIDPGEQPADAIVREIHEETGVHAVADPLVGVARLRIDTALKEDEAAWFARPGSRHEALG